MVASEYMNKPVIVGTDVLNWVGVRTRDSQLLTREFISSDGVMAVQSDLSLPINTPLVDDQLQQLLTFINEFSQYLRPS